MKHNRFGFTIVELLIVIVVIGILAAISIVAYNSVTQKARDSQRISDINKIQKGLSLWGAESGKNFSELGGGSGGTGVGWVGAAYSPHSSVFHILITNGYLDRSLSDPVNKTGSGYMIAPCRAGDLYNKERVILAKLEAPPAKTVYEQIGVTCPSNSGTATYISSYGMNYGALVSI